MDFKSLVNRLDQLSEATKETPTGKVHKADQGGYGRKNYEDDKKKEKVAEPAVKRGRGRPRKDADSETGEVKKFDTSALSGHFGGKLPGDASKSGRTVSKMASAEKAVSAYNKMREKDKSHAEALRDAAEKYGISQSKLNRYIEDEKLDEVAPPVAKAEKASKKTKLKDWIDYIDENMLAENEQITVQPAKSDTQVIKQGTTTLGTVSNPQLAQQIKQSIGKGEMTLAGSELGEDGMGKNYNWGEDKEAQDWLKDPKLETQVLKLIAYGIKLNAPEKGIKGIGQGTGLGKEYYDYETTASNPMYFKEFLKYLIKNGYRYKVKGIPTQPAQQNKNSIEQGEMSLGEDKEAQDWLYTHTDGSKYRVTNKGGNYFATVVVSNKKYNIPFVDIGGRALGYGFGSVKDAVNQIYNNIMRSPSNMRVSAPKEFLQKGYSQQGVAEGFENTPPMIAKLFSDNKQLFDMATQGNITPQLKKLVSVWGASSPWGMNTDTRNPEWIDDTLQHLLQNYYPSWKAKQGLAAHAKRQGLGEEDMDEGKFVKAAGGVPSDRHGNPKIEKPPTDVSVASLKQLEKNKRENPNQSPFRTQDEKVKRYLGLEEQGVAEGGNISGGFELSPEDRLRMINPQQLKKILDMWEKKVKENPSPEVMAKAIPQIELVKKVLYGDGQSVAEADIPSDQMDMGAGLGAGRSSTTLEGKKAKPDFLDMDKDGNKKESMKKAASDKKKKVNESSHRHSAARLMGKSHALAKEGYNCRYEDMDEAREYHEGFKEGLDECYGQGVYEMAAMPASVPAMANAAMPSMEEDMFDEAMFDEGNAFTGALAKTPKGGKFSLGGKTFTDTSDLDEMSLAFESLDKQLKSLLESEEVSEGMTVSISKGQQGAPDSVSVTAQDAEADQLLGLIKHAGLGLFGDEQQSGYGATDSVAQDHGDIKVVGDHDGMMSIMKKISGIEDSSNDYEDEESHGHDEHDQSEEEVCETCNEAQCQCESEEPIQEVETEDQMAFNVSEDDSEKKETTADEEKVDESYANSDDDTFEADINFMTKAISGGLDKEKSTGQTTIPVIAGQNDRMGYSTNESIGDWKKLAGIK